MFILFNCNPASFWCLFWINYMLLQCNSFEKYWIISSYYIFGLVFKWLHLNTWRKQYHGINNIARHYWLPNWFLLCRFKQSLSAMEICRRPVKSIFDVNQNATSIMSNLVPPSTSNLTVSFNNQINALHTQVRNHTLLITLLATLLKSYWEWLKN